MNHVSDIRIRRLGKLLVRYCLDVRRGQTVGVSSTTVAEPLVESVYAELLDAGAYPVLHFSPPSLPSIFFSHARSIHLDRVSPYLKRYADVVDATLSIYAQNRTRALSGVDPKLQMRVAKAQRSVSDTLSGKRWCLTLFPTLAYAREAGMTLKEFSEFVFHAMGVDDPNPEKLWLGIRRRQQRLIAKLEGAEKVELVGKDTRLKLSIKGRHFVNSDGKRNMPSGEIFAAPVETSADGVVRFDYPVCYQGRVISDVRLVFRNGEVVEAHAGHGQDFLHAMLKTDRGAVRLGEIGIGTNGRIDRFVRNILFDEKIAGTVHLALGRSPDQTLGRNRSAIHWDLIKDLRHGGVVIVDGRVFQENGRFKDRF